MGINKEFLKQIQKMTESTFENVIIMAKGEETKDYTFADIVKVEADKVFCHNRVFAVYNCCDMDKAMNVVYGDTWHKMSENEAQKRYDSLPWKPALVVYIEQK